MEEQNLFEEQNPFDRVWEQYEEKLVSRTLSFEEMLAVPVQDTFFLHFLMHLAPVQTVSRSPSVKLTSDESDYEQFSVDDCVEECVEEEFESSSESEESESEQVSQVSHAAQLSKVSQVSKVSRQTSKVSHGSKLGKRKRTEIRQMPAPPQFTDANNEFWSSIPSKWQVIVPPTPIPCIRWTKVPKSAIKKTGRQTVNAFGLLVALGAHHRNTWLNRAMTHVVVTDKKHQHNLRGFLIAAKNSRKETPYYDALPSKSQPAPATLLMAKFTTPQGADMWHFMYWKPQVFEKCPLIDFAGKCLYEKTCPIKKHD